MHTFITYITIVCTAIALNPNRQRDSINCFSLDHRVQTHIIFYFSSRDHSTSYLGRFLVLYLVLLSLSDIIFFQSSRSYPRRSLEKVTIIAAFLLHHYLISAAYSGVVPTAQIGFLSNSSSLSFLSFLFLSFFSFVSSLANMSAEGQEIRDERVEEPTATATPQEEGGDDEVCFSLWRYNLISQASEQASRQMANCPSAAYRKKLK